MTDLLALTGLTNASAYQTAVFQHAADQVVARSKGQPVQNLVVEATAGSGKTTTSVATAKLFTTTSIAALTGRRGVNMKVLFLAFNKAIATELQSRLEQGQNQEAKTLNSLGWGIWGRYYKTVYGRYPQMVKGNKTATIMRNMYTYEERQNYGEDVLFLVGKAISAGFAPSLTNLPAEGIDGKTDSDENLLVLCDHYERDVKPRDQNMVFRMVREVMKAAFEDEGNCSFDDQKWFPVVKRTENGLPIGSDKYDVVLVDESQDLSQLDAALVKMICKPNTITIFVGDREQSLYGFRGADARSIDNLIRDFSAKVLPLSISYRCGKAIVEKARMVSARIEASPTAHDGLVRTLTSYNPSVFKAGDMIVCRNNAPLVSMAFRLIAAKVPVHMKGRDLGANLISLINKISGTKKGGEFTFGSKTTTDLVGDLDEWLATQSEIIRAKDPDDQSSVQSLHDRYDTIMVFVRENKDGRISSVINDIRALFHTDEFGAEKATDGAGKVILSSVHRAKGLETDRVFILNPNLFRPGWVKPNTWQYQQEINIEFVAITRAKFELTYIQLEDMA